MSGAQSEITIGCIQMEPVVGAKQANLASSLERIEQAAGEGARLIVLPELANSGYVFRDRDEAFALAEEVPAGETTAAWSDAARRHNVYIVAGIAERAGGALYNSAVVLGPSAISARFAKCICGPPKTCSSSRVTSAFRSSRHHRPHRRCHLLRRVVSGNISAAGAAGRRYRLCPHQLGADSRPGSRPPGDGEYFTSGCGALEFPLHCLRRPCWNRAWSAF